MAVGVSDGLHHRAVTEIVDTEEHMRSGGGTDTVDSDQYVAVGAVLESDRHRQARGELAVHLRFSGAGP